MIHHGHLWGGFQPAFLSDQRSSAAERTGLHHTVAKASPPGSEKAHQQTGCLKLNGGTPLLYCKTLPGFSLIEESNFLLVPSRSEAPQLCGCKSAAGFRSFMYPSLSTAALPLRYLSSMSSAYGSQVRNALLLIKKLKTAHGYNLLVCVAVKRRFPISGGSPKHPAITHLFSFIPKQ